MKRAFDIAASALALITLAPLLIALALIVKSTSSGPVLFRHERIGRSYVPFDVLKFRTMRSGNAGAQITTADDTRITPVGKILRRYKLDELPQLVNVLRGEMSIVGPRPEVSKYVEMDERYAKVLQVRPGLTDPASLKFRHEQELLAAQPDPEPFYVEELLPEKVRLSVDYVENQSMSTDLRLIGETLRALLK